MQVMEISSKEMEVRPNSILDLKVDASFRKIAKNAICFHVWKIEEDRLEAEPKAQYGTFFDDCAYIVYAAGPVGIYVNQDTITREAKAGTNLERFIHFWLGEKVSEQKRSNVAHKIQELDSYFGNVATEYRETQDNESARFLSYFKREITIRCGALAASAEPNRLFQLRGRKWLRCIEMEKISWEYFGSDYIMLLQTKPHVYVWIGRSSSTAERRDAIEMASKFQSDSAEITIVDDGYEQSMPAKRKQAWNTFLPLNQRMVSQTSPTLDIQHSSKLKIYKCGYRGSRLHLDQLDVVIPTKDDLSDSTTAYVLDGFAQGVWLWVGAQASHQDNISAMGNGRAFVKKKKYPYSTPVVRVVEGHEPIEFTRLFPNWQNDWNESTSTYKPVSTILGKFDSVTLCQRPKMAADTQLIDDGSGERTIYRITKDQVIEMPVSKVVMFNTNSCYVVQYLVAFASANPSDAQNVGVKSIVYQWNGSEATADAIAKGERFSKTRFESLRDKAMFVQMCEFDETPHFLQIFEGKLIILQSNDLHINHNNNNNNNNNNITNGTTNSDANKTHEHFVLKVYGDASYNSKAVEVYPLTSMSSKECYVLKTSHVWVWCGQSSTGDAREVAKNIGALLGESSLVMEGKEPKDFWRSITNQMHQPIITNGGSVSSKSNSNSNGNISPPLGGYLSTNASKTRPLAQLFLVWAVRGKYFSREIIGYEQSDLSPESVYVLDAGLTSYIWLGAHASTYEQEKYLRMAQNYLETVPIARRPTTAVAVVRQNDEPNAFKGFFENWNHTYWNNYVSYEQKRQLYASLTDTPTSNGKSSLNGEMGNSPLPPALLNNQKDFDRHHKYPIATLQQETDQLPTEVNPLKREVHLTHDDFVALFSMSFWEFDELPVWKKQELKKKHKLF